ncbi:exopolyphosphatase [Magnetospirillum moscoviense]|uniref:Exopolyphosphatase n=1 Tax=Magnetospirillum moscoviense TaxID=1437059 RepID=A0A178MZ25_9PROT|nr:exopolyphosphatase [Magnetospirillum moscoviense]MBF0326962.1 exopolyphosphatase [Alphaproteobacteria bacterium]OAN65480.1 exopolyphosphatase [Magnetospirillum moscoviense]
MSENKKFRLVTRSDFDGLVCAVLLKQLDIIDDIKFVHPKDMQDGVIDIGPNDITTNVPYVEGVHIAFDHHLSETIRVGKKDNHIIHPDAPSAARVVYDYYGGAVRFPAAWDKMMEEVDKADSAQYSLDDIISPTGWTVLNYIMDARTGLGRFREFRISNYQLMMNLIDYCRNHTIDDILALPDVKERTDLFFEHEEKAKDQIKRCSTVYGNVVVLNLKDEETIWACNRFMIYALYPQCNISIHVMWGLKQQNTVFAIGHSIVNRTSKTSVGALCLTYGGGGHEKAGTCQVENATWQDSLKEVVGKLNADG